MRTPPEAPTVLHVVTPDQRWMETVRLPDPALSSRARQAGQGPVAVNLDGPDAAHDESMTTSHAMGSARPDEHQA